MAITKYDQFDFLIDIVPRDSIDKTGRDILIYNRFPINLVFLG